MGHDGVVLLDVEGREPASSGLSQACWRERHQTLIMAVARVISTWASSVGALVLGRRSFTESAAIEAPSPLNRGTLRGFALDREPRAIWACEAWGEPATPRERAGRSRGSALHGLGEGPHSPGQWMVARLPVWTRSPSSCACTAAKDRERIWCIRSKAERRSVG